VGGVLARELAEDYPLVDVDTDAFDAARILAFNNLPGLVVTDSEGSPYAVLPASQVVRFVVPEYVREDPSLARVIEERAADQIARSLAGRRVRDLLPERLHELPVVRADDTVLELAALMAQVRSPLVAVVDQGRIIGVVTAARLLALGCGTV
jgi:predicted transcriptional regulator